MHFLFYYPSIGLGGQQTQIMQISEQLNLLGHKVSWLYNYDHELIEQAKNFCQIKKVVVPRFNRSKYGIIRLINRWLYYNLLEIQIKKYCENNDVDVILSSNTVDSRVLGRVSRALNLLHFRMVGGGLTQTEPHLMAKYQKWKVDDNVSAYLGWPAVFEELKAVGVSENKFYDLPFGVNTDKFYPLEEKTVMEFRRKLGIQDDTTVIGWIGRIASNMQIWDTLEVCKRLKERNVTGFKMLFIGGGTDFELLKTKVQTYGLENLTILTGWIPYEEVNQYINAMDIIPLLEEDPHGGSIVREAMACGRLAVSVLGPSATQASFMKPNATILVKSDDYVEDATTHISELIGKRELINEMGIMARAYVMENLRFIDQAHLILRATEECMRK